MDEVEQNVSYQSLLEKFERTKKELGDAEETIKRLTGRNPDLFANTPGNLNKWKNLPGLPPSRPFPKRKRPLFPIGKVKEDEELIQPEEESPDEDETPTKKPSLQSTVVATPKDAKSRKDTIQEQNANSKVKARNRRMLGMILGTLQKFQHEAKKRKEQDLKRAEIEQKVEAAAAEEKERIKKEKEELFQTRREKQIQLRCLEKKLEIAELHEIWEKNQRDMLNFIKTKTKPHLFYGPSKHSPESEKRLEETRTEILESIQQHKEKMEKELQEVEEWYKKDHFPSDKENIGPLENNETVDNSLPEGEPTEDQLAENNVETEDLVENEEDRTNEKDLEKHITDQEFEPIYD
ncbi:pinin-like [Argiope bruennichi]|uniref:pinin-like n=1 Tax=Argiope bruennichi TaxID=94029 RepID=UPI0024945257|nr:pinin-like [Argiope bruennichi]